ncbi:MAG: glycosyl transferase family 2, partial [Humibacillus sp.]|nr:glycosyl transferase family 2 [Humibacillus sp.]
MLRSPSAGGDGRPVPDQPTGVVTTPAGAGAVATSVLPSTGRRPAVTVDVVMIVRDGASWVPQCLEAIAAQQAPINRLLVVDVASTDTSVAVARAHQGVRRAVGSVEVLRLDTPMTLGEALAQAVAALPLDAPRSLDPAAPGDAADPDPAAAALDPADAWVWVLHEGAPATPSTLARLLTAGQASRSVGIVGPKLVAWHDSRRLLELGIQVTRTGRRLAVPVPGEVDQGQYDGREDVLAIHTDGMLVRRSVWDDLDGLDRTFAQHGAALDLGWRTQLAGHRVVVVPAAVVRDAGLPLLTAAGGDHHADPGAPATSGRDRRERR